MGSPYGFAGSRFSEPRESGFCRTKLPPGAPWNGTSMTADFEDVNRSARIVRWAR